MATITANNGAAGNFQDGTSWVGGVAPTAADDAVLPAGCTSMTIGTGSVCRSLTTTAFTGTLTHTAGVTLNIGDGTAGAGNVALAFGTFTYTLGDAVTSAIAFISTSATVQTINFNGKTTGRVTFNAASNGSWKYTGGHTCGGGAADMLKLTKGSLDTNGQTCNWGTFQSNSGSTRSLTLGASQINITGTFGGTPWDVTAAGMTTSAASSTITFTGGALTFGGGNQTYGTVIFNGFAGNCFIRSEGATFGALTRIGSAAKTDNLILTSNITVTGTLTLTGNSPINRLLIQTNATGTKYTITNTSTTMTITNTDFMDIGFSTTWNASAQTDIGDCGGNSGITFPASVAQYYGYGQFTGSYYRHRGISGGGISAPDSVATSITSDIDIQCRVSLDDWTPATQSSLVSKWNSGGNQRGYTFFVTGSSGTLKLLISSNGSSSTGTESTAATGFTDGTAHWLRVTYVKSTGVIQYFTADDSASVPSSWTQLGIDVTVTADTAIFDNTAGVEIGVIGDGSSAPSLGNFYRARVLSGVGGTVVFDAILSSVTANAQSFTESSAQGATVSMKNSSGNWSSSLWTTRVPLPQDDCYMGNAYAASQTVTADMPRLGRSIDWTGATGSPTWSLPNDAFVYGNLTKVSGMSETGNFIISFGGRFSYSMTSSGVNSAHSYTFNAPGGTFSLNDALTCKGIRADNGTFISNNYTITLNQAFSAFTSNTGTRTVNFGTSNIIFSSNGLQSTPWNVVGGLVLTSSSFTISLTGTSTATKTFAGASLNYGTINYTVAGSTGELDITGSNSFAAINFSDASNARSLKFTAGTTTTIRNGNGFNVRGTSGKLMTIDTISGAGTFTLTSPNVQSTDYMNVIRSTVDASPKWYAGANSTDGTGNTNWIFTNSPESVNSFTQYSPQYCLNFIYGTPDTQYSLQEIANLYNGTPSTKLSFQEVLNNRAGRTPNAMSAQEALFTNVKTVLGLSDPYTQYPLQYLLNLCKSRGIGLSTIFG